MTATTQHTPTPWIAKKYHPQCEPGSLLESVGGDHLADIFDEHDAVFIVTACNAHDELVAALKWAADVLEATSREKPFGGNGYACMKSARAALAKAGV